jgi:hypothetical protein
MLTLAADALAIELDYPVKDSSAWLVVDLGGQLPHVSSWHDKVEAIQPWPLDAPLQSLLAANRLLQSLPDNAAASLRCVVVCCGPTLPWPRPLTSEANGRSYVKRVLKTPLSDLF